MEVSKDWGDNSTNLEEARFAEKCVKWWWWGINIKAFKSWNLVTLPQESWSHFRLPRVPETSTTQYEALNCRGETVGRQQRQKGRGGK